ncbi:DNA internalization-related competence protein ComEC/Rec2 [Fictibacillus sp. UD]|uniref:DNA internalization-related competence protein ComEC/Rec2 n=1 Tax=Fictibacillus sp. UD TaxID=3038777 RepID=UPI003744C33C
MNPRYAVLSALVALCGIWLSKYQTVTGIAGTAFLVIVIVIQIKRKSLLILCFLPLFFIYSQYDLKHSKSKIPHDQMIFTGQINTIPKIDGKMLRFHYETNNETIVVQHKMKSSIEKEQLSNLEINMTCMLKGNLKEPEQKSHFYGMDYPEYLKNKDIYWILETRDFNLDHCQMKNKLDFQDKIKVWRSRAIQQIESQFSKNTAGLMNALLFGYRDGIESGTLQAYQRLGLTHLLAVSGFNVGIVSFILYFFFVRVGIVKEFAYLIIIFFLPVYIVLTGGESSIIRAGLMGIIVMLVMMFRKKVSPATLLSGVCIGMLVYHPSYSFELGFQLSFLMTFVLITSISLFQGRSYISLLIMTSFMCSLFSFPIILYHFYEFSIWSIPFNMIYIPFVSFVLLPISFVALVLSFSVPGVISHVSFFIEFVFGFSVTLLTYAQSLKGSIVLGRPATWLFVFYFISIFYFFYKWEVNKRFQLQLAIPFLLIILIHTFIPYFNSKATVTFLNVGQGDSILIELPYRKAVYLIDTGGTISFDKEDWEKREEEYDVTKEVVLPFLKAKGIREIDGMIISHGDMDHAGGAIFLLEDFKVNTVYLPLNQSDNELEETIQIAAQAKDIELIRLSKGMQWGTDQTFFYVLHPGSSPYSSNNGSIVLWVNLFNQRFLFTGDLEKEGEAEIMYNFNDLHADVLKIGHHGSATSSTDDFLKKLSPQYAIISAGKNNIYGHPAHEVVERLKHERIEIYRTDQHGDISFEVGKESLKIRTSQ